MATLTEILIAVRELAFDRYPIPTFVLQVQTGKFIKNDATNFLIKPNAGAATPDFTYTYNPDENTDVVENLTNALITGNKVIAYTGYYSAFDKVSQLLKYTDKPFGTTPITMFRRFFQSDVKLIDIIIEYYARVLEITVTSVTLPTEIQLLNAVTTRHLTLWVALTIIDLRRIAEQAASVYQLNWSDGSGPVAGANLNSPGENITVNIGSVFTLSDDNSVTSNYFNEDFNRVGSENVLGDKESWWFKLWLYLRDKLEREFSDFSFRGDNVIVGKINLQKDLNYFAYYDSYPYTYSKIARDIIS